MLNFKELIENETNEFIEITESNYQKILNENDDDGETLELFEEYAQKAGKRIIILCEDRFDQIDELLEEAEARVWMYRSYIEDNRDDLPDYIKVTRNENRKEYSEKYNLNIKDGKPINPDIFDSYEYWEGVMAACRYLSGYGVCQTLDNVRTGEDLLDT